MSRRVAFTTLSPEAAAEISRPMATPTATDALPELTGARHLENMISNWDHLAAGGTAETVPHQEKRRTPTRKPARVKKAPKPKKVKQPKGKSAYQQRLLKAATAPRTGSRGGRVSLGIPLTNRTTLRSLLWKLPWTTKPLSTLMRMEGWLNPRATLQSIIHRIPQAKKPITVKTAEGVKN